MSAYSQRLPAWLKHGDDLSISGFQEQSQCNWPSSQAGELLSICLDRPACEHNSWNAYGGTRVGPKTALCKADLNCPAGLAVNEALLLAQRRFAVENRKLSVRSDRQSALCSSSALRRDQKESSRVNVYFAFLRSGARPRPILPPLTVQEVSLFALLLSQSELVRPRTQLTRIPSTCPKRHRAGNPGQSMM
jgi:hypothetical protein